MRKNVENDVIDVTFERIYNTDINPSSFWFSLKISYQAKQSSHKRY